MRLLVWKVYSDRVYDEPTSLKCPFQNDLGKVSGSEYLPSYAPELNLIEILWRFMKYYWLPFSAYASFQCLSEAVEEVLTRIGTDYTINFQAA